MISSNKSINPKKNQGTVSSRSIKEEGYVHLMTIHKSKGLEYDYVYCPFMWYSRSNNKNNDKVLYVKGQNILHLSSNKIPDSHEREHFYYTLSEEMRLLYVAITRAKKEVFIGYGHLKSACKSIHNPLYYYLHFAKTLKEDFNREFLLENLKDVLENISNGFTGEIAITDFQSLEKKSENTIHFDFFRIRFARSIRSSPRK